MTDTNILNIEKIQKKEISINKKKNSKNNFCDFNNTFLILIFLLLLINLYYIFKVYSEQIIEKIIINNSQKESTSNSVYSIKLNNFDNPQFESFDVQILEQIKFKIKDIIALTFDEQKFLNGIIRKIKPKKIVEIGVACGGSSAIILNSIKDINEAKLFSIEKLSNCYMVPNKKAGFIVEEKFPELMNKWTLYRESITAKVIESIGKDIDLVFIDTMHITPGEMLDFLQVLPFLKEEAIVVLHDTFLMFYNGNVEKQKKNYSNNQILVYVRGELLLPNYNYKVFSHNIGAIKLCKGQNKFYRHYFMALGTQWEFMPDNADLKLIRKFFMKYYGNKYVEIYDDAVEKNKIHLNK